MRLLPSAVRVWVCSCSSFVLPGELLVKLQITEWRGGGLGGAGRGHAACTPCWGATLSHGSLGCCSQARKVAAPSWSVLEGKPSLRNGVTEQAKPGSNPQSRLSPWRFLGAVWVYGISPALTLWVRG